MAIIRFFLLLAVCTVPFLAKSQTTPSVQNLPELLPPEQALGTFGQIYRLDASKAATLYKTRDQWEGNNKKSNPLFEQLATTLLLQTPLDTFHSYAPTRPLPVGHYALVRAQGEQLYIAILSINQLQTYVIQHPRAFEIRITDSIGNVVPKAIVRLGGTLATFDPKTQTWKIPHQKKGGFLEVNSQNESLFLEVAEESGNPYPTRWWRHHRNYGLGKIIYWPIKKVALITQLLRYRFSNGRKHWAWQNYREQKIINRNQFRGYVALNQPKYMPGDTLHFKAYITNRKGKPFKKALDITLRKEGSSAPIFKKKIRPVSPGAYVLDLYLADSLKLDHWYNISIEGDLIKKIDYKPRLEQRFFLEDYQLDVVEYEIKPSAPIYQFGDSIQIELNAKDANNQPVPEVQARVVLLTTQSSDYQEDDLWIPDTLWTSVQQLGNRGKVTPAVPSTIWPKCKVTVQAKVFFVNSAGEQQEKSCYFNVLPEKQQPALILKDSSGFLLSYWALSKNQRIPTGGDNGLISFTWPDGRTSTTSVRLPYRDTLRHAIESVKIHSARQTVWWDTPDSRIKIYGNRIQDTVYFHAVNPDRYPVFYQVIAGTQIVTEVFNQDVHWRWKSSEYAETTIYVKAIYIKEGEEQTKYETIEYTPNELTISLNQPDEVRPGSTIQVKVEVKDQRQRPANNVNLTAGAYNQQFKEGNPYSGPYLHVRQTKRMFEMANFYAESQNRIEAKIPLRQSWHQRLALDSLLFYRLRYRTNLTQPAYMESWLLPRDSTSKDTLPQIAPFVVNGGQAEPIYLIYLNKKLVYYYGAVEAPYSFWARKGANSLQIRTRTGQYSIENLQLENGRKYEFALDATANRTTIMQDQQIRVSYKTMPDTLTATEKTLLQSTMLWWRPSKNKAQTAYFWQHNTGIQRVEPSYRDPIRLLGPFATGIPISYLNPGHFLRTLDFEPGFEYSIEQNRERLYEKKWPIRQKLQPNPPLRLPGQRVWTKDNIQFSTGPAYIPSFFSPKNSSQTRTGAIAFEISPVSNDSAWQAIVLIQQHGNKDSIVGTYSAHVRKLERLSPGMYQIRLFAFNGYVAERSIEVRKDSLHFIRFTRTDFQLPTRGRDLRSTLEPWRIGSVKPRASTPSTFSQWPGSDANYLLSGTVIGDDGEPLIGASIKVSQAGTLIRGAVTDVEGRYQISVAPGVYDLVFSYTGCASQEVQGVVASLQVSNTVDVTLQASYQLNEVVVTGYGAHVSADRVSALSTRNVNALMGTISGYDATITGGEVSIKGSRSSATNYYVDGVRVSDMLLPLTELDFANNQLTGAMPELGDPSGLRTNFKDYAYWKSNLITDKKGEAYYQVTFPDNITGWNTFVIGMDGHNRAGITNKLTQSFKPLTAQLSLPRFAIAGDRFDVAGLLTNFGQDSVSVRTVFYQNGRLLTQKNQKIGAALAEYASVQVPATGTDSLHIGYEMQSQEANDGERRSIAVQLPGTMQTEGSYWFMQDSTVIWHPKQPGIPAQIHIENNVLAVLKDDVQFLIDYPYGCNEQTASRLTALILAQKIHRRAPEITLGKHRTPEDLNKAIVACIQRLRKAQNVDGSWGWWPEGKPNSWMTIYVLQALLQAKAANYNTEALDNGLIWLRTYIAALPVHEGQKALDLLLKAGVNMDCKPLLQQPFPGKASRFEKLAHLRLLQRCGERISKDSLLDYLEPANSFFLMEEGTPNWRIYGRDATATILAYEIAMDAKWTDITARIREDWFKTHANQDLTTFEKAQILYYLIESLPAQYAVGALPEIMVNGQKIAALPLTRTLALEESMSQEGVRISTNGGPVFATVYQQWHDDNPLANPKDFLVETTMQQQKRTLDETAPLQRGVATELVVRVRAKKNSDYVMIEIPILAGCSYGEKIQNNRFGIEVHREYFRDRVAIFCEAMPKGDYEFRIPLEPRFSGTFTLNPAKAEEMYFPTFFGRTGMRKVEIR